MKIDEFFNPDAKYIENANAFLESSYDPTFAKLNYRIDAWKVDDKVIMKSSISKTFSN